MRYAINELSAYQKNFSSLLMRERSEVPGLVSKDFCRAAEEVLRTFQDSFTKIEGNIIHSLTGKMELLIDTPLKRDAEMINILLNKISEMKIISQPLQSVSLSQPDPSECFVFRH